MVAFYLDNDVSARVGDLLTGYGHTVTLTRDLHQTRAHDEVQLLTALELQASLVTHNYKDFALLHRAWELWRARWHIAEFHPSILVLLHGAEMQSAHAITDLLSRGLPARSALYRHRSSGVWVPE